MALAGASFPYGRKEDREQQNNQSLLQGNVKNCDWESATLYLPNIFKDSICQAWLSLAFNFDFK